MGTDCVIKRETGEYAAPPLLSVEAIWHLPSAIMEICGPEGFENYGMRNDMYHLLSGELGVLDIWYYAYQEEADKKNIGAEEFESMIMGLETILHGEYREEYTEEQRTLAAKLLAFPRFMLQNKLEIHVW